MQGEKLEEYLERFTQGKQLARIQLGKNFLDGFVSNTTEYKVLLEDKKKKIMKN